MDSADLTAEPTLQQLEALLRLKDPGHQLGAIQGWPPGPARTAVEATAAFNQDDWAMAESLLRQLLEHPFNNQQFFSYKLLISLHALDRHVEAMGVALELLVRHPASPYVHLTLLRLSSLCLELCMPGHWFDCINRLGFDQARFSEGDRAKMSYVAGILHLFEGNYSEGWRCNQARYEAGFSVRPSLPFPEIRVNQFNDFGRKLNLVMYADGGLGDLLFSFRFVSLIRPRVSRLVLICPSSLVSFARATSLFDAVSALDEVQDQKADGWMHLNDLPLALDIQRPEPSLCAPLDLRLASSGSSSQAIQDDSPLVALNWQGSPFGESIYSIGLRNRSFLIADLERIISLRKCRLISVQIGPNSHQIRSSVLAQNLVPEQQDFDSSPNNFLKTATVLWDVDLLITNDTSVAHLGGMLGVPTWVLLNVHAYWQWGQQGSTTPWYPSVRCFRQPTMGDWTSVMEQVDAALQDRIASQRLS